MRLTLRTLLSYLDDTLAPSEAKLMGAKLAESEAAQEIVERIKNVIRRRRITVAPTTTLIDANTLAEYLDNEITPEAAEELERICLSSDVHLAEVAACHQILSLVLGEAPAAPEDANKRMYHLIKDPKPANVMARLARDGDPSKPKRTKEKSAERPLPVNREADETLRIGLPSFLAKNANRLMFVAAGALACLLLVVAVVQLLKKPATPDENLVVKNDPPKKIDGPELISIAPKPETVEPKKVDPPEVKDPKVDPSIEPKVEPKIEPKIEPKVDPKPPAAGDLPPPTFTASPDQKIADIVAGIVFDPPSDKSVPIGKFLDPGKDQVGVVLQQLAKGTDWKPVALKDDVMSARPMIAVPGSKTPIVTQKGVKVTLWGNMPEHIPLPPVQESQVTFHDHAALDLDMTLSRGRVLLANLREDPVTVRVRLENPSEPGGPETFLLLTLHDGKTEVLIDRWSFIPPGEPFIKAKDDPTRRGPIAQVAMMAVSGTTFIKTPSETMTISPPPSANLAVWTSNSKKLFTIDNPTLPIWLGPKATTPADILKTRQEVRDAFTGKAVDVAITELLKAGDIKTRRTAVRCLGAIDDLPGLIDVLNQDKPEQRHAAIETLRLWVGASRDNEYKLHDQLKARLKPLEAELFMELLHGFNAPMAARPETFEILIERLRHNQMSIRELAAFNLYQLAPAGQGIPYDAADPAKREKAYQQWIKLVPPGKLPPAPAKKTAGTFGGPQRVALPAPSVLQTLRDSRGAGEEVVADPRIGRRSPLT